MKIEKICGHESPSVGELMLFLSRYSARLLGAGATCIRLETNVGRIAKAYGMEIEMTIMTRHIQLSLWKEGRSGMESATATVNRNVISFNINTLLSKLSWEMADGKVDFATAQARFDDIVRNDRQNRWIVMLLVAFANASFCRLFGGDMVAMGVVGIATLAGYFLKILLLDGGVDVRVMAIVCSFVSAVMGASDYLFGLGTTPDIALGTSVLYLVPGIPFINSFSDMIYRHYLCSISRFADAVVLTCCLSMGLCAAMLLMDSGMF